MKHPSLRLLAGLSLLALHAGASATNGYFAHGYGMKALGMGGAAVAMSQEAYAGAVNPAASAFAGDRFDLGLSWFSPKRGADRTGSTYGLNGSVDSDSTNFFIPEFGYNRVLSPAWSIGLTVYGNGGMNTDFPPGQINCGMGAANMLCGFGRLGVDMSQLIVAVPVAWKFHERHSVGIAPLFGYQRFEANGIQPFAQYSQAPANVTNQGYDSSTGWGARVGYQGRLTDTFTLGAAYATKMSMGKFDKYKGLFAGDGGFDIPSHWAIGAAWQALPSLLLALDFERINYSDVASVHNPSTNQAPLGSANGPGFGWQDINVWKLGVQWQAMPELQLRAGYNRGGNPISSRDVTFNILAPGTVQNHYTLGATWQLGGNWEVSGTFAYMQKESVTGSSLFNGLLAPGAGGTETIWLKETLLGVSVGRRF
jgi:long-chain fatty acid transport protein